MEPRRAGLCRRLTLTFLLGSSLLVAGIAHVPTDASVYEDLERLRVAGLVRTMPSTSRPWTRATIGRLVFEADSLSQGRVLAPGLQAALRRVTREYQGYLWLDGGYGRPRRPVLDLAVPAADRQARVRLDLFSRGGLVAARAGTRGHGSFGTVLDSRPGDNFAFYQQGEFTLYRPDTIDVPYADSGRYVPGTRVHAWRGGLGTLQLEHVWLAFRLPWQLRLAVGRDRYRWGQGYTGAVMLGDEAPGLDHVALVADYGRLKFQALTAYLSRWEMHHRFVSLQRVELALWDRLRLGGVLAGVYSWDSLQTRNFFGLMNPLIPIYAEIANSGHRDNLLAGWDAVLDLAPFRLYGTLFIDNYEFFRRPTVPNAYATQYGVRWVPNLPLDFQAEHVGISPFTYYHRIHQTMYEQYGVPLGHSLGPDADLFDVRLGLFPVEPVRLALFARQTRRGYYNRGDHERKSWWEGKMPPARFPSEFPEEEDGLVEQERGFGLEVEYRPFRDLRVAGEGSWSRRRNADGGTETVSGPGFALGFEYRY